jgi:hypothetical protein
MSITVYHNTRFLDRMSWQWGEDVFPMRCDLVEAAQVFTNDREEAYWLTNSSDQPWLINNGVDPTGLSKRSTSCGDILIGEDGVAYLVSAIGFCRCRSLDFIMCAKCGTHPVGVAGDWCLRCQDERDRCKRCHQNFDGCRCEDLGFKGSEGLCSRCGNFPVNPGSDFCIHCFLALETFGGSGAPL